MTAALKHIARTAFLAVGVCLLLAGQEAAAQAIVLKDGTRIPAEDFKIEGGKIVRTVRLQGDKTATTILAPSNIAQLDWPYSAELIESRSLLAQGKTEEAIGVLKTGKEFFEAFKDVKGGGELYRDVFFAYVEALAQGGKFDDTIASMPALQKLSLNKEQEVRLKVIKLNIERQTSSDYVSIIAQAKNILADTDDSGISAAVWEIIGDIHDKKKEYEEALMAYLRVPVFYGTQIQRVPAAELKAARMLAKMRRFEDATQFFTRLVESYPGSAVATEAAKEKASIHGMKNDENPQKSGDEKASQA